MSTETETQISRSEAAKLLWDEFKYFHEQYWSAFYKFGFMIVLVNVIPYLKPDIVCTIHLRVIMFPIVGILMTLAGTWILSARYQRLAMMKKKYDEVLSKNFLPDRMPRNHWWEKIVTFRLGVIVFIVFGVGLLMLSVANIIILHDYNQSFSAKVHNERVEQSQNTRAAHP